MDKKNKNFVDYYSLVFYGHGSDLVGYLDYLLNSGSISFYCYILHIKPNPDACDHFHVLVKATSTFSVFSFSDRATRWAPHTSESVKLWFPYVLCSRKFYAAFGIPFSSFSYSIKDFICSDYSFLTDNFEDIIDSYSSY